MKYNLKELVKYSVKFKEYRKGNLWYTAQQFDKEAGVIDLFDFPVPIEDIGDATFMSTEKGIHMMRYIRKHLDTLESGNTL